MLSSLERCFSTLISKGDIDKIIKGLEAENATRELGKEDMEVIVSKMKAFVEQSKEALKDKVANSLKDLPTRERKRRRREVNDQVFPHNQKDAALNQVTSGAGKLSSWIDSIVGVTARGFGKLGNFLSFRGKTSPYLHGSYPNVDRGSSQRGLELRVDVNSTMLLLDVCIVF